jgi:hypothetical protein
VTRRNLNALFDDDATVAVDANTGLLQTINASSTDQTVNALAAIASAVGSALSFGAELGAAPKVGAKGVETPEDEEALATAQREAVFSSFQIVVDDVEREKTAYVASPDAINQRVLGAFTVTLTAPNMTDGNNANGNNAAPAKEELPNKVNGIAVRVGVPCTVTVRSKVFSVGLKSGKFSVTELSDLKSFAEEVRTPADPNGISQYIKSKLNGPTTALLQNYPVSTPGPALQHALVETLNGLAQEPSLYLKERFSAVNLSPETRFLIGQVTRMNKQLLVESLPGLGQNKALIEVRDLAALAQALTGRNATPVGQAILAELTAATKMLVTGYQGGADANLANALALELNDIATRRSLYDKRLFPMALSKTAQDLVMNVQRDMSRMNQALLLDAYPLELTKTNDQYTVGDFTAPSQMVMLPDIKHDYYFTVVRAPLVTNNTKVALTNGMIQSLEEIRPSILLGVVGIPKTILGALVPIPLQIQQSQQNMVESIQKTIEAKEKIQGKQSVPADQ